MQAARDCPSCMMCGAGNDGTIIGAHYCGIRQQNLGKGIGQKPTDSAVAYLCHSCHVRMDQYHDGNNQSRSEIFFFAIIKSHDWLFKNKPEIFK